MISAPSGMQGFINNNEIPPLEIPQTSLLSSLTLILETIGSQEERKIERIKFNYEEKIKSRDYNIESLNKEIAELTDTLDLIPDYKNERISFSNYHPRNPIGKAREWIKAKINEKPESEDKIADLMEKFQSLHKENVSLQHQLNNVKNNGLDTSKIFLPQNKKLVPLTKAKKLPGSGTLLNTVITIPNGYELEKVILKKVK